MNAPASIIDVPSSSSSIVDDHQEQLPPRHQSSQKKHTAEAQPTMHNSTVKPPVPPRSPRRSRDANFLGSISPSLNRGLNKDKVATGSDRMSHNHTGNLSNDSQNKGDQLEARISSILTTIPARIRLTSGPGVNAPEVSRPQTSSSAKKLDFNTPPSRLIRTQTSTPTTTLAPAYAKTKSQSGDQDIKLYHLHQPGKDVPIKLFVRLVGEGGERVMVRVGGGWADLGEYLKEYASHHGRRSISDGRFEIQGLPQSLSSSPITPNNGALNGWTTPMSRPGSPTYRPEPSLTMKKTRMSLGSPADFTSWNTLEGPDLKSEDTTPGSASSFAGSVRPISRMSWTDEDVPLGLAGPKSKQTEISPGKKAWVEGMLDKARRGSVGKKSKGEFDFGDLRKVRSTKRVYLKSNRDDQIDRS